MIQSIHLPRIARAPRRLLLLLVLTAGIRPLAAQQTPPPTIRWWHAALAAGGVSLLMSLDQPVHHFVQSNRSSATDGFADVVRHFGEVELYVPLAAGLVLGGVVSGDDGVARAGGRLAASMALAAGSMGLAKSVVGRARPDDIGSDGDEFSPFSHRTSMPSGHTAMAFALATSLADDIDHPVATVGLYAAAGAVGWSRMNDNRHWFSDVAAGALFGITAAKVAGGRWSIFGLRAPRFLAGPGRVGIGWDARF